MEPLPRSVVLVEFLFQLFKFLIDRSTLLPISRDVSPCRSDGSLQSVVSGSGLEHGGLRLFRVVVFVFEFFVQIVLAYIFLILFAFLLIHMEAFLFLYFRSFFILIKLVVVPPNDGGAATSGSPVGLLVRLPFLLERGHWQSVPLFQVFQVTNFFLDDFLQLLILTLLFLIQDG